jgi:hypothetical protein
MRTRHPAPHHGLVHDIVVVESADVGQLYGDCGGHDALTRLIPELGAQEHQKRT